MFRTLTLMSGLIFALSRVPISTGWGLLWQLPTLLVLWFLLACTFVGLFVIGHDCGHRAFSSRRWVNDLVGHLCMALFLTGFHNWRIAHNRHHQRTQVRGEDPDWPERMVTHAEYQKLPAFERLCVRLGFGSVAGILVGFWVGVVRRLALPAGYPQLPLRRRDHWDAALSTLVMLAGTGGLVGFLGWVAGPWGVIRYYGAPVLIAAALGSLITLLHHSHAETLVFEAEDWCPFRGQVLATFQVRFPRLFEWLWLDINLHLPHHLAPQIPWYHLRQASEALLRAYPAYHQERPFRWRELQVLWSHPLLHRDEQRGLYVLRALDE